MSKLKASLLLPDVLINEKMGLNINGLIIDGVFTVTVTDDGYSRKVTEFIVKDNTVQMAHETELHWCKLSWGNEVLRPIREKIVNQVEAIALTIANETHEKFWKFVLTDSKTSDNV